MRLWQLAEQLHSRLGPAVVVHAGPGGQADPEIRRVVYDSRRAADGSLFCCVPGQQVDGHAFAGDAVAPGRGGAARRAPARHGRAADRGVRRPPRHGRGRRHLLGRPVDRARGDRRDRHQWQDHGHAPAGCGAVRRRLAVLRAGHVVGQPDDTRGARPAGGVRDRRVRPALGRSPWRSPPTPWRSSGWWARTSRWRCSRTSARTTWTSTARRPPTSPPRPACSRQTGPTARW